MRSVSFSQLILRMPWRRGLPFWGLAVNIASAWLLGHGDHHGHSHEHHYSDDHAHDNNLRSAYFHVLADALTSVLAIGALLAGRFLGWTWLDAAMGIVGALVIAKWSWGLLRDTAAVLLDAVANRSLEEEIREPIQDGDARITDLHVWQVAPADTLRSFRLWQLIHFRPQNMLRR